MNDDRFQVLIEKLLEGGLVDDEARELIEAPEPFQSRLHDEVALANLLARVHAAPPKDLGLKVQAALRGRTEKDAMLSRVLGNLPRERRWVRPLLTLAAVGLIALALSILFKSEAPPPIVPPPEVRKVELGADTKAAVAKAVEYLRHAKFPSASHQTPAPSEDLVLWALLHAGVPHEDPMVEKLLKITLAAKLQRTYTVSVHAMALQQLDSVKYQGRIADCAQFLVDNQCLNGQWSYGTPTVAAGPGGIVKKTRDGPLSGNNSCSQFAAMAVRACVDAGIAMPAETYDRAMRSWRDCQRPESEGRVGWCYTRDEAPPHRPYGSMTAGGVASLVIWNHLAKRDWRQDKTAQAGLSWLRHHFTTVEHFGPVEELMAKEMISDTPNPNTELYYWFWTAGRAATLCGLDKLGTQDWYAEGLRELLATQKADGSWSSGVKRCQPVWDTCYAILFLTRSTRPLGD